MRKKSIQTPKKPLEQIIVALTDNRLEVCRLRKIYREIYYL